MKYPAKRAAAMRTLTIPELSGGVNSRDGIADILDNQVSAIKNLWYKSGALRTRPAVYGYGVKDIAATGPQENVSLPLTDDNTKVIRTNITVTQNGKKYNLCGFAYSDSDITPNSIKVDTYLLGVNDRKELASGFHVTKTSGRPVKDIRLFYVQYGEDLYLFNGEEYAVHRYGQNGWTKLNYNEMYAPLVAIGLSAFNSSPADAPKGTLMDGYNLLGRYYKAEYTTVNTDLLNASSQASAHEMKYPLLNSINDNNQLGLIVTVKYTDKNGAEHEHTATVKEVTENAGTENETTVIKAEEVAAGTDGLRIAVTDNVLKFLSSAVGEPDVIKTVTIADLIRDNMTVTAPVLNRTENMDKVFACTVSEWFGGAAEGISGGTRLFLGGNVMDKTLVVRSGLNNPLYFPGNNDFRVGESSSAVTAFGKQSNLLIIFKENEVWSAQYTQASITAEDVSEVKVVDDQANSVYFPLRLLTSQVGCDLPHTVQLCSNRLVWACKNRKVYTLVTENQYSERNVYAASAMVSGILPEDMSGALSADCEGCYWLFVGRNAYVMDYESYGFRYISSYSKVEDAASRIPWWYFEFPDGRPLTVPVIDSVLLKPTLISVKQGQNTLFYIDFEKFIPLESKDRIHTNTGTINDIMISTAFESKVFEFGAPQYNKNIYQVDLGLRANGGVPIRVSYMTESAERDDDDYVICAVNASDRSSRNIQNIQLRPALRGVSRFGLRLECDGGMELNHIAINYTITGGAK